MTFRIRDGRAASAALALLLGACGDGGGDSTPGERLRRDARVEREIGSAPEDARRPGPEDAVGRDARGRDASASDAAVLDASASDAGPGFDAAADAGPGFDVGLDAADAAPAPADLGGPEDVPDFGDVTRPAPWPDAGALPEACEGPAGPEAGGVALRVEAAVPGRFGAAGAVHDAAGRLVVATRNGDLERIELDGTRTLWVERVARTPRGMAFLSTGELVLADSGLGRLLLVYPGGETRTLLSDLDAPMDVEVDARDFVYVTEATRGAIREVDPLTRRSRRIVDALPQAPGALAFSPDQRRLYVAFAGSGAIFAVDRDAAGDFGEMRPFARLAEDDPRCAGLAAGARCDDGAVCRAGADGVLACVGEGVCGPEDIGQPCGAGGLCQPDGVGGAYCSGDAACEDDAPGAVCVWSGFPRICAVEAGSGRRLCGFPPCTGASTGDVCTDVEGVAGRCADNLVGRLYCQSSMPCRGRLEGAPCRDVDRDLDGRCVRAGRADLYCETVNPCDGVREGARCTAPLDGRAGVCTSDPNSGRLWCRAPSDAPCAGAFDGEPCQTPSGRPGQCFDTTEARVCFDPEPCQAQGQACTAAQGQPGTCEPDATGELGCRAAICFGAADGAPCQDEDLGPGSCLGGACLPAAICDAAPEGTPCPSPRTGAPGVCGAGAGATRLCLPLDPCAGALEGAACEVRPGLAGTCAAAAGGGRALTCDVGRGPGVVRALETDACGFLYAADDGAESVWRIGPDGAGRTRVAALWRGAVTALTWAPPGADAEGTLLAVARGGADVLAIATGRPARRTVRPLVDAVEPRGRADARAAACLALPDAPIAQRPVPGARGYHDVAFDAEGAIIGFDGVSLVRVDGVGASELLAAGLAGAEGMDRLPDESLVVATGAGLVRVFPNGAQVIIAPDIHAYGVTVGPDGRVYAGDNGGTLWRVDPDTTEVVAWWSGDGVAGLAPRTIAFDVDHSLLYFGVFGDQVYSIPVGPDLEPLAPPRPLAVVSGSGGAFLDGLTVDICGQLYLPKYEVSALYRVTPDGESRLYYQWDRTQYGHGLEWGRGLGGFSREALYFPQPYNGNTVLEMSIGVRGARD
jgi:sugar lactone lactonase YvrE